MSSIQLLFSPGCRFTDDTVMTVATIDSLLHGKPFAESYKAWYQKYPDVGYGRSFQQWARSAGYEPYYSWGNGSAMRVSPVGFYYQSLDDVLDIAKESAAATHNHPEGIKGAQAVSSAIFLARQGETKAQIKEYVESKFGYALDEPLASIREWYQFDVSCQGSVPQAITAFLESADVEDAVRNAVSIGGDSDTIACIAGAIAEAYYKSIPDFVMTEVKKRLDHDMLLIIEAFYEIMK